MRDFKFTGRKRLAQIKFQQPSGLNETIHFRLEEVRAAAPKSRLKESRRHNVTVM